MNEGGSGGDVDIDDGLMVHGLRPEVNVQGFVSAICVWGEQGEWRNEKSSMATSGIQHPRQECP